MTLALSFPSLLTSLGTHTLHFPQAKPFLRKYGLSVTAELSTLLLLMYLPLNLKQTLKSKE